MATGQKKTKILVLRLVKSGDIDVKCEGGKWAKQTAGAEIDSILKMVTDVLQKAPLDAKEPVEFSCQRTSNTQNISILNGLETTTFTCVRDGS